MRPCCALPQLLVSTSTAKPLWLSISLVVWLSIKLPVRSFIGLIVWSSCGCARPGCALPQLLVSTSTAQLPLTHPCVSQKPFLLEEHHCWSDLLPPLLTQTPPAHPSQPQPGLQKGPPRSLPPSPPCPSQHRSTGAQLSVRAALRPATAGV